MSHFTVGVILNDIEDLYNALEPFGEELKVEPYIEETKQQIIENSKQIKEEHINDEKKENYLLSTLNAVTDEEFYQAGIDREGYESDDIDEQGNYISTYNPNTKWDWYSLGGRFNETILVKGKNYVKGEKSLFDTSVEREAPKGYTWASAGMIKDIAFDKMNESQEFKEPFNENVSVFSTDALINDGKWYEKGEMGNFAVEDSTKESEIAFMKKFKEVLNAEKNQNKWFAIVDCHI